MLEHQLVVGAVVEWRMASQQKIGETPQHVDVDAAIQMGGSHHAFGSGVTGSPGENAVEAFPRSAVFSGQTEIQDLDEIGQIAPLGDEDVRRLDVAVDDPVSV